MKRHPVVRPAPRPADGSCQCGDVHIRKRVHPRPARGTVPAVDARQCDPESPCKDNSKSVLFRTRIILAEACLCVNQRPWRTFSKARFESVETFRRWHCHTQSATDSICRRPAPIGLVSLHFDFPFVRGPSRTRPLTHAAPHARGPARTPSSRRAAPVPSRRESTGVDRNRVARRSRPQGPAQIEAIAPLFHQISKQRFCSTI